MNPHTHLTLQQSEGFYLIHFAPLIVSWKVCPTASQSSVEEFSDQRCPHMIHQPTNSYPIANSYPTNLVLITPDSSLH